MHEGEADSAHPNTPKGPSLLVQLKQKQDDTFPLSNEQRSSTHRVGEKRKVDCLSDVSGGGLGTQDLCTAPSDGGIGQWCCYWRLGAPALSAHRCVGQAAASAVASPAITGQGRCYTAASAACAFVWACGRGCLCTSGAIACDCPHPVGVRLRMQGCRWSPPPPA